MSIHRAKKRFGQNFLQDQQLIERIISAIAPQPNDAMIEIGPGLGAITVPLLDAINRLTVIELDRDIIPKLEQQCQGHGSLTVINQDILKTDLTSLVPDHKKIRIVGNLPYNISTPILFHLLKHYDHIADMHFMLQKEVVDRMAAQPGNKIYGRLSVMLQYYCEITPLIKVPPHSFLPQPKVDSMIVRLVPHQALPHPCNDMKSLQQIVTQAFNQRRKTLANTLKGTLSAENISHCGIDPKIRPEQVTLAQYVQLANLSIRSQ